MGYIIAFLIFILLISFLGLLFSFLWPLIIIAVIVGAITNYRAYKKRQKKFQQFYDGESSTYYEEDNNATKDQDDIIDVEFSEQEINEK